MTVGKLVSISSSNGEKYTGKVVSIKADPKKRSHYTTTIDCGAFIVIHKENSLTRNQFISTPLFGVNDKQLKYNKVESIKGHY